jgi:hypothetical protein
MSRYFHISSQHCKSLCKAYINGISATIYFKCAAYLYIFLNLGVMYPLKKLKNSVDLFLFLCFFLKGFMGSVKFTHWNQMTILHVLHFLKIVTFDFQGSPCYSPPPLHIRYSPHVQVHVSEDTYSNQ